MTFRVNFPTDVTPCQAGAQGSLTPTPDPSAGGAGKSLSSAAPA